VPSCTCNGTGLPQCCLAGGVVLSHRIPAPCTACRPVVAAHQQDPGLDDGQDAEDPHADDGLRAVAPPARVPLPILGAERLVLRQRECGCALNRHEAATRNWQQSAATAAEAAAALPAAMRAHPGPRCLQGCSRAARTLNRFISWHSQVSRQQAAQSAAMWRHESRRCCRSSSTSIPAISPAATRQASHNTPPAAKNLLCRQAATRAEPLGMLLPLLQATTRVRAAGGAGGLTTPVTLLALRRDHRWYATHSVCRLSSRAHAFVWLGSSKETGTRGVCKAVLLLA
jgi:hypothetical protein